MNLDDLIEYAVALGLGSLATWLGLCWWAGGQS